MLILTFATVSGSHFNPVVTLSDVLTGGRGWADAAGYIPAQIIGCIGGAILANLMFGDSAVSISTTDRLDPGTFLAEILATARAGLACLGAEDQAWIFGKTAQTLYPALR